MLGRIVCGILGLGLTIAAPALAAHYSVVDRIPGPDGGWDYIRVDTRHDRLLIPRGSAVMTIDLATRTITPGLAPGGRQHVALPVDDGREWLVTNGADDTALFADAATGTKLAAVATGKGPDAAALDPKSGLALVAAHVGGELDLIDPAAHKAVAAISVGGKLEEIAADGGGRAFVNVEDRNEIAVIDLAARKVVARWPLAGCDGPTGLAFDKADGLLIAACDGSTALVSARDGRVVKTLATGKGADGVVFDPRRRLAFVPAGRDGVLSVIGFGKPGPRVVQTVPTQKGARTIAEDERTGRLYLPSAEYVPAAVAGGRPTPKPGTFQVIVVAPQ